MYLPSLVKFLDKPLMEKIHKGTAEILEKCGINFENEEALLIFKKAGAEVDGKNVRIPLSLLEKTLALTPKSFTFSGLDAQKSILVGEGQERPHADPNLGNVMMYEYGFGHRLATTKDLIANLKLIEASEICNIGGGYPVDPCDMPQEGKHLLLFRELLRHTTKPFRNFVATKNQLEEMYEMLGIIKGKDFIHEHTCMFVAVNPLSPLAFDDNSSQTLVFSAKNHQAVCCQACAISGFTAPMSMLGSVVMQNAEILAANALMQLVNPNAPFIFGPGTARPDMRTGLFSNGSPETAIMNIASLQLAREYYHIPTRVMAGLTDSKTCDVQAGYETMQTLLTAIMGGAQIIHGCTASMDTFKMMSFEQFVVGEEIFSRVLRFTKGIYGLDKELSINEIIDTKPGGAYILNEATLQNCSNTWLPSISTQQPYDEWKSEGEKSMAERANAKWKEILANCPDSVINQGQDEELTKYIAQKGYNA